MARPIAVRTAVVTGAALLAVLTACGGPEPSPRPSEGLIWAGDLETGDLSQFQDTPWNTVAARPPTVVEEPVLVGDYALRMSIPAGATTDDFGARSEVVPAIEDFAPGDDLYFGLSMYLEDGFPVQETWQVVTQWKSDVDGSPPLELDVADGRFQLAGGGGHPLRDDVAFVEDLGPTVTGRWIDWVVHVRFSADPAVGAVEMWRDGVQVVSRMSPPGGTMYPDPDGGPSGYVKYGYYRRSGIGPAGSVVYDDLRVGTTFAAVARTSG